MHEPRRIERFADFWPFYLGEHRSTANRALHFLGSSLGLLCWIGFLVTWNVWLLALGFLVGYGLAWIGHFLLERNRPASFRYPLWSFRADWKMWFLLLTGQLRTELIRLSPDEASASSYKKQALPSRMK